MPQRDYIIIVNKHFGGILSPISGMQGRNYFNETYLSKIENRSTGKIVKY